MGLVKSLDALIAKWLSIAQEKRPQQQVWAFKKATITSKDPASTIGHQYHGYKKNSSSDTTKLEYCGDEDSTKSSRVDEPAKAADLCDRGIGQSFVSSACPPDDRTKYRKDRGITALKALDFIWTDPWDPLAIMDFMSENDERPAFVKDPSSVEVMRNSPNPIEFRFTSKDFLKWTADYLGAADCTMDAIADDLNDYNASVPSIVQDFQNMAMSKVALTVQQGRRASTMNELLDDLDEMR